MEAQYAAFTYRRYGNIYAARAACVLKKYLHELFFRTVADGAFLYFAVLKKYNGRNTHNTKLDRERGLFIDIDFADFYLGRRTLRRFLQ